MENKYYSKTQANIMPIYGEDVEKFITLSGIDNKQQLLDIINFEANQFNQDEYQEYFSGNILQRAINYKKENNVEITDKFSVMFLHIINKAMQFLPLNYPAVLIANLIEENKNLVENIGYFDELKEIKTINSPLTLMHIIKLGQLLRYRRTEIQSLFTDNLVAYKVYEETDLSPRIAVTKRQLKTRNGVKYYSVFYANTRKLINFIDTIVPNYADSIDVVYQNKKTGYYYLFDKFKFENLTPEQQKKYHKLNKITPYIQMRFWYILAKALGFYSVSEVREKFDALPEKQLSEFHRIVEVFCEKNIEEFI